MWRHNSSFNLEAYLSNRSALAGVFLNHASVFCRNILGHDSALSWSVPVVVPRCSPIAECDGVGVTTLSSSTTA